MKKHKKQEKKKGAPRAKSGTYRPKKTGSAYHMVEATFMGTRSGFGFGRVEGMEEDIFIPPHATGCAMDGDTVLLRYRNQYGGSRTEGEVVRILSYGRESAIGTLYEETLYYGSSGRRYSTRFTVVPDDSRISIPLYVKEVGDAKTGDKVEVRFGARHPYDTEIICYIVHNFGSATSREANYQAILADCAVPTVFSDEVLAEAEAVASEPITHEGRIDRTEEMIFTIDGEDAKDLDDAISLRTHRDGTYHLGVHIADVSHYVRRGSLLDAEAMARGTSVYFTDKVVPMLPECLSNGACSLHPGGDKYALSAVMHLSPEGAILSTTVTRSVIRSRVKGVYTEVNDLFQNGKASAFYEKYREVYPTLTRMRALYRILKEKSEARGAMDLQRAEASILLDGEGMPVEIVARERGDAEKLIEQFMLTANEGVATLMQDKGLPCVYRVHEKPSEERLADFLTYAHNVGLATAHINAKDPTTHSLSLLLEEAKARGNHNPVSMTLLRAMAKAKYSSEPHIHYGLGIEKYCHFTSPIRRLSDLATHRMVKATLLDKEDSRAYLSYATRAADAASETELRALSAERRIEALYKTLFMARHVGEEFTATVTSITSFGLFAELDNTCEGMIPLGELPGGVWVYDEGTCSLRMGRETISLGDKITVRVEEADVSRGRVRFSLLNIVEHVAPATVGIVPKGSTPLHKGKKPSTRQSAKHVSSHPSHKGGKGSRSKGGKGRKHR